MIVTFDHLALAANDLEIGTALAEVALSKAAADCRFAGGGTHDLMATHNRLLGLGGIYLEVIAVNPAAPPPGRARWFDLDRFCEPLRLTNWVVRCDDLEAALDLCPPGMGAPLQLQRGPYRWRMAVPQDGRLPFDGCFPALIEWQGAAHPVQALPQNGLRLIRLRIAHPRAAALRAALAAVFDDDRVVIAEGPSPAMTALIGGPDGQTELS